MKTLYCWILFVAACSLARAAVEFPVDPKSFAKSSAVGVLKNGQVDPLGGLTKDEVKKYVIAKEKLAETVDLSAVLTGDLAFAPGETKYTTLAQAVEGVLMKRAAKQIVPIQDHFGGVYPVSVTELRELHEYPKKLAAAQKAAKEEVERIAAAGGQASGAAGKNQPSDVAKIEKKGLRLRKSRDKWNDDLADASGAIFTLAQDYRKKTKTLSGEGALIYPIQLSTREWSFVPSLSWNNARVDDTPEGIAAKAAAAAAAIAAGGTPTAAAAGPKDGEINELQLTFALVTQHVVTNSNWLQFSTVEYAPYYLSDSHHRGKLLGLSLTWTPMILPVRENAAADEPRAGMFAVNSLYRGTGIDGLRYRLGAVPGLDFNHVYHNSEYFEKDERADYLRFGGKLEVGFKIVDRLEFLWSYKFFSGISGPTKWSEHRSLSGKWWFNDHVGVSVERQKGETPIADKPVNSFTVGFEAKF